MSLNQKLNEMRPQKNDGMAAIEMQKLPFPFDGNVPFTK